MDLCCVLAAFPAVMALLYVYGKAVERAYPPEE